MKKIMNKNTAATLIAALTFGASTTIAPVIANAATTQSTSSEQTFYISEARLLDYIKNNYPNSYAKIPDSLKGEAGIQQGTTKVVKTKTGFKIYLNSAIIKILKYSAIGAAGAATALVAAGITTITTGVGAASFGAVTAVVSTIASSTDDSRGVIITFSSKGSLISWVKQ